MNEMMKKKEAGSAIGYVVMFTVALLMVVLTLYLAQVAKLMTHQRVDESHRIFMDCMNDAIADTNGFYYNFAFDEFICYEVEGGSIRITSYSGAAGTRNVRSGSVGSVRTPNGEVVRETSAYGRVKFDIENIIDKSLLTKSKDIYCTLEINN